MRCGRKNREGEGGREVLMKLENREGEGGREV